MVIYLDVLIFINIFVTYFLLLSSEFVIKRKAKKWRLACGALFGGFSSLLIFLPPLPEIVLLLEKLAISFCMVWLVFGFENWKLFIKQTGCFYLINFIYAGFMSALWFFVTPTGMSYRNGIAYFNINAVVLVVSTVIVYLILCVAERFWKRTPQTDEMVTVRLNYSGRETVVTAFVDTGNQLYDTISGVPIVICELRSVKGCLPDEVYNALACNQVEYIQSEQWKARIKILPMGAVTGEGILLGLKPDHIWIEKEKELKEIQAIVGFTQRTLSDGDFTMLISPQLLENT